MSGVCIVRGVQEDTYHSDDGRRQHGAPVSYYGTVVNPPGRSWPGRLDHHRLTPGWPHGLTVRPLVPPLVPLRTWLAPAALALRPPGRALAPAALALHPGTTEPAPGPLQALCAAAVRHGWRARRAYYVGYLPRAGGGGGSSTTPREVAGVALSHSSIRFYIYVSWYRPYMGKAKWTRDTSLLWVRANGKLQLKTVRKVSAKVIDVVIRLGGYA